MKFNTGIAEFARDVIAKFRMRFFALILLSVICAIADGFRMVIAFMLLPFLGVPLEGSAAKLSEFLKQVLEAIGFGYNLTAVGTLVISIFALQTLLELLQNRYQYNYAHSYTLVWRKQLFSGLCRARWRYFLDSNRGQLINVLSQETAKLSQTVIRLLIFISTLLVALAYLGASFAISIEASLLMVLVGLSMIIFNTFFLKRLMMHARASVKGNNEVMRIAQEFLNNIKAVKASPHGYAMEKLVSSPLATIFKSERAAASLPNTSRIIAEFLIMMALVTGIIMASQSGADIASSEILLVMVLFIRTYGKITMTMMTIQQMYVLLPSFKSVSETYQKINEEEEALWQAGQQLPKGALQIIRFESICVHYGNKAALDNINVELNSNSIVALVGTSGAGKTTFVDTLLRLTEIDSGRITWNGNDIGNFNVQSWRSCFGYVTQELSLINSSLADNIRLFKPDADMEAVRKAARMAHADEFIARLPEQYDTQVGDMGLKLSGGQRQRIAIARALINDPPILILDEATSALDAESEEIVMETILCFREHKLILVIAHRLSTIKEADKILVLEHGRLVEEGDWSSLVNSTGRFNQLWKKLS